MHIEITLLLLILFMFLIVCKFFKKKKRVTFDETKNKVYII